MAFAFINYIRELITQKLDDNRIHFLYARMFCRRHTSEVSQCLSLEQSLCFDGTCGVCVHMKRVKRSRNGGSDDFLLNCNIDCKKHTTYLALVALSGLLALLQEKFSL